MDGVMPAFITADGVGAAWIISSGCQRVVAPFAMGLANRVDGREIQHVESHGGDARELADHILEIAMPAPIACLAAWEHFVPAGKTGIHRFDIDKKRLGGGSEFPQICFTHQSGCRRSQQNAPALVLLGGVKRA